MNQSNLPISGAEDRYIASAVLHRERLEAGNVRGSNAAHDGLIDAIREIRNRPDRGRAFLLEALDHADENVRLWSAAHLLPLEEKIALAQLKQLGKEAGSRVVRSSAEITEEQWRKGDLDIDWFMKK